MSLIYDVLYEILTDIIMPIVGLIIFALPPFFVSRYFYRRFCKVFNYIVNYVVNNNIQVSIKYINLFSLILSYIFTITYFIFMHFAIQSSSISTASIGYIYLPYYCGFIFLSTFVISCVYFLSVNIVLRGCLYLTCFSKKSILWLAVLVMFMISYFIYVLVYNLHIQELYKTYYQVKSIMNMNSFQLEGSFNEIMKTVPSKYDIFAIAAIADNPNSSSELLNKISQINHPRMDDKLFNLIDLNGYNRKGLSVTRLLLYNHNVSSETLMRLFDYDNEYLPYDIAAIQEKLTSDLIRKLYIKYKNKKGKDYVYQRMKIKEIIKSNPKTPEDIKKELDQINN